MAIADAPFPRQTGLFGKKLVVSRVSGGPVLATAATAAATVHCDSPGAPDTTAPETKARKTVASDGSMVTDEAGRKKKAFSSFLLFKRLQQRREEKRRRRGVANV